MERKRSARRGYSSSRRPKPLGEKIKDFLRHFVAFMFSNVGIIGLVVGYTIIGAFIFQKIEGDNPVVQIKRLDAGRLLNETADRLWNLTCCGLIPLEEHVWRNEVTRLVQAYQNEFVKTMKSQGSDSAKSTDNWSFSGAFLYSLTVITTIGYGNVTPRSEWGKVTTVVYAIIGMPLFLLYLSNIGDILAKSFKWTYAKLWLCKGCPGARRRRLARAMQQQGHHAKHTPKAAPPPAAMGFGDDRSWAPGAHPASLPHRGRVPAGAAAGGVVPGVHGPYWPYDGYLEGHRPPGHWRGPRGAAAGPRGRRGHPAYHQEEDEDDDEDAWRQTTASPEWRRHHRQRKLSVDYGRGGRSDEDDEEDGDDWDGDADPRRRPRSRSGLHADRQAAGHFHRGRTPASPTSLSASPADFHGQWDGAGGGSAGRRTPRGKSSETSTRAGDDTDLEAGFREAHGRHRAEAPRRPRGRQDPGPRGPRRGRGRRRHEYGEEEEEEASSGEVSDEEEEAEETPSTDEELDEEEAEEEEEEEEEEFGDMDNGEVADEDTDGESSSQSSYDPQTVTVPVTLCLAIMVGYVCGGAVLFANWEGWDMLDGSYFCFISLSTIGFGDLVPGSQVITSKIEWTFIFCSMYLMLGMALIAMCFNLMQEEVIHKMRSCIRTMRYVTRCNRRRATTG